MVNRYILDELMKIDSDNSTSIFESLDILRDFKVELISDEKYDIIYRVKLSDILDSSFDNSTLLKLRNGGWSYDDNKEYLIKNMNI